MYALLQVREQPQLRREKCSSRSYANVYVYLVRREPYQKKYKFLSVNFLSLSFAQLQAPKLRMLSRTATFLEKHMLSTA